MVFFRINFLIFLIVLSFFTSSCLSSTSASSSSSAHYYCYYYCDYYCGQVSECPSVQVSDCLLKAFAIKLRNLLLGAHHYVWWCSRVICLLMNCKCHFKFLQKLYLNVLRFLCFDVHFTPQFMGDEFEKRNAFFNVSN